MLAGAPIVLTWGPEGAKSVFSADPDTFGPGANDALAVLVGEGFVGLRLAAASGHSSTTTARERLIVSPRASRRRTPLLAKDRR
jgi:hypothetical protein